MTNKMQNEKFTSTGIQDKIFEVIKVAIENEYIHKGSSPQETAKNISEFARTLKKELLKSND